MIDSIIQELQKYSDKEKAAFFPYFFKTGEGGYAKDDKFIGVTVPNQRKVAKQFFKEISLPDTGKLLSSEIHEHRLTSLFILIYKYEKARTDVEREEIVDFYLKNLKYINNWDLVDASCYKILGNYLLDKDRSLLYDLAKTGELWKERIAIVTTMAFIKKHDFKDTLKISEILMHHKHDLIHKAVGWMLREMGKVDVKVLVEFLAKHYKKMPRTMLRYAIEKFDEVTRKAYLKGTI